VIGRGGVHLAACCSSVGAGILATVFHSNLELVGRLFARAAPAFVVVPRAVAAVLVLAPMGATPGRRRPSISAFRGSPTVLCPTCS
jgi:hypothetical protein